MLLYTGHLTRYFTNQESKCFFSDRTCLEVYILESRILEPSEKNKKLVCEVEKGEKSSGGEIEVLMADSEANRRETNLVRVIERSTQEILDSRNRDSTISIYMFDFFQDKYLHH